MDYLKRERLRVRAVEALIDAGDFADAVRESQESVELDPATAGPLLAPDEVERIEPASKTLRRDRDLSFYGDEDVGPLEYYERSDADAALASLQEVLRIAGVAFERNGTAVPED